MTRAEKLEAAGAFMHCTCPVDSEGERERAFIERLDADGRHIRDWYALTNPLCPLHGANSEPTPY